MKQPVSSPIYSPIYSMTGFARVQGRVSENLGFTLSLKSVNHRYLDLHLRMPGGTEALEMKLRRILKEKLVRGHAELTLSLDRAARAGESYDAALVGSYLAAFRAAALAHGLACEPDLNTIFQMPGIFSTENRTPEEDMEQLDAAVLGQMDVLVAALNTMREHEGATLVAELRAALDRLSGFVQQAAELREGVQQAYFERLQQRIATMLNGSFDRDRLLQEAALLAERSDIEEEIARLRTHIAHFHSLLDAGGEVGKKLDFLLQEFNREANTLLSKTNGAAGSGSNITEIGLGMKSEIEKIREQVQNLE